MPSRGYAGCRVVRCGQRRASETGPSFLEIARKGGELDWLDGFLADPHPPMPDMSLNRQEIRDLRAYFNSLRN
ncbi:MAG: hypothetical protein RIB84_29890 [Sneathiellaceae bacterium]